MPARCGAVLSVFDLFIEVSNTEQGEYLMGNYPGSKPTIGKRRMFGYAHPIVHSNDML